MTSTLTFLILLTALVAVVLIARSVRRVLPKHHYHVATRIVAITVKLGDGSVRRTGIRSLRALALALVVSSGSGPVQARQLVQRK